MPGGVAILPSQQYKWLRGSGSWPSAIIKGGLSSRLELQLELELQARGCDTRGEAAPACIHSSALARLHFLKHQSEYVVVGVVGANGNVVSSLSSSTHQPLEDPLSQPLPLKSEQQIHYAVNILVRIITTTIILNPHNY